MSKYVDVPYSVAVCEFCNNKIVYAPGNKPLTCRNCGHDMRKPMKKYFDDIPKGSVDSHIQVGWSCQSCNSKGVAWIEKGKKFPKCPKCGHDDYKFYKQRIPAEGRYDMLWAEDLEGRPTKFPRPKKKMVTCNRCGWKCTYLIKRPETCMSCGEKYKNAESQNSTST